MSRRPTRVLALSAAAVTAVTLSACASSDRDSEGEGAEQTGGTFVFGAPGDPAMFDPAFATDGESFRITRQLYDGLLTTKAGSADIEPALAEDYAVSDDGLEYTFTLREGVTFTDGTDFNAEAVCFNFDRWYNFEGMAATPAASEYYQNVFGGFASTPDVPSLYESCEATDESTAVITITQVTSRFPAALTLPSFAMQSPTALEEYDANNLSGSEDALTYPAYATDHPTGTGPFKFDKWERGQQVSLVPNEDYWGDKAKLDSVIIRTIEDGNARKQALQNGEIDGYDLVAPGDLKSLEDGGFQIENRPAFNILYLGINQAVPQLADVRVRQAIAHAIDKEAVVSQSLPEGTVVATQPSSKPLSPDTVCGGPCDGTLNGVVRF